MQIFIQIATIVHTDARIAKLSFLNN